MLCFSLGIGPLLQQWEHLLDVLGLRGVRGLLNCLLIYSLPRLGLWGKCISVVVLEVCESSCLALWEAW